MTAIRLLLVDDDPLVRAGLALMLGDAEDVEIVGEAADGDEVGALVDRTRRTSSSWTSGCRWWTASPRPSGCGERADAPQVVVLTTFHADEQVLRALRAGAAGFVLKDTPPPRSSTRCAGSRPETQSRSPAVTRRLMQQAAGTAPDVRRTSARARVERSQRPRTRSRRPRSAAAWPTPTSRPPS